MANFDVSIRRGLSDIGGLAGLWSPNDFSLENGEITQWRNRATKLTNRFDNLINYPGALRPTVGPNGGVLFDANGGASKAMGAVTIGSPGPAGEWSFGTSFRKGPLATIPQLLLAQPMSDSFIWARRYTADFGYSTDAGGIVTGSGDLPDGGHLWSPDGGGTADWLIDNVATITGGASDDILFDATRPLIVGGQDGNAFAGLDGEMTQLAIWKRRLSPKEQDLVFQYLSTDGVDRSDGVGADPRAAVEHRVWGDDTGDLSLGQVSRLNPVAGRLHHYAIATIPTGEAAAIVQLACNTAGTADGSTVVPDTELGGDLYVMSFVEKPTPTIPLITQDAGWSSIFDIRFTVPGHYTILFERPGAGGMYVHLDVERIEPGP